MVTFMRTIGFNMTVEREDLLNGTFPGKIDFKTFLSIFEFNMDNTIQFRFETESGT